MHRALPLLLLLLAGLLLWWVFVAAEPSPPAEPALETSNTPEDGPTLEASGSEPAQSEGVAAALPGRVWRLQVAAVRAQDFGWRSLYDVDWLEEGAELERKEPAFEGKRVRIERRYGTATETLADLSLDEHGRAEVALPALAALDAVERAGSVLLVHPLDADVHLAPEPNWVSSRKFPFGVQRLRLPGRVDAKDVRLLLVMEAHTGGTVHGRAQLPGGAPAANASVSLHDPKGSQYIPTCADAEGRFAVAVRKAGTFDIRVRAPNGSQLVRKSVALPSERDVDLGLFELRGTERFAGRVTFPDGTPASGIDVQAEWMTLRPPVERGHLPCGGYTYESKSHTRADGSFEVFAPAAASDAEAGWQGVNVSASVPGPGGVRLLDPEQWMMGTSREKLRAIVQAHRLTVRTLDAKGRPLSGARVELRRQRETGRARGYFDTLGLRSDRQGRCEPFLPRGSTWGVSVLLDGCVPESRIVEVPTKTNESTLEVTLLPLEGPVQLGCVLRAPDGSALLPTVFTIWTEGGAELFSRRIDKPGFTFPVAGGRRYRIEAWATEDPAWKDGSHGSPFVRRWLPVTRTVEVPAGKGLIAELPTKSAAHLEIVVRRLPGGPHGKEMPWSIDVELEHEESGRRLSPSGPPCPVHTRRTSKVLTEDLEPGPWIVRMSARKLKSVTRKIMLEAGSLGRVEFLVEWQ